MKKRITSPPGISLVIMIIALSLGLLNGSVTELAAQSNASSPTDKQKGTVFIPVIVSGANAVASQQDTLVSDTTPSPPPDVPTQPQPNLPVLPEPEHETQSFTYEKATRGQVVRLGEVDVKLPDDAYIEGVIVGILPIIGTAHLNPPIAELRRGDAMANVEINTGRIEFIAASKEKRDQDKLAFDFLVKALGEDKIMEVHDDQ